MVELKDYDELKLRRIVLIENDCGGSVFKIKILTVYKMEFEDSYNDFYIIRYQDENRREHEIKVKTLELSEIEIKKFHKKYEIIKGV